MSRQEKYHAGKTEEALGKAGEVTEATEARSGGPGEVTGTTEARSGGAGEVTEAAGARSGGPGEASGNGKKTGKRRKTAAGGPAGRRDSSLPAALLVCVFLFLWQAAALKMNAAYILPTPVQVVRKLWDLRGPLFGAHLPATMQVVGIGLAISIVLGLGLAILMDLSPVARQALYPLIIASQTIPTTALAPLFVLWFGYSIWSRVLVTVLFTFFPVVVTVFDGFRSIPVEMKELMDTYGATPAQVFVKLKIPAVLPYFFSALKMAVPLSVIGAAIGEWLGAQSGLGYFSRRMMTQLDGAGVFAPILLLSIAAELLVIIVGALERHFLRWRNSD